MRPFFCSPFGEFAFGTRGKEAASLGRPPPCFALWRTHMARTCRESPKTAPFTLKIIPLSSPPSKEETDYDLLRHLRTTYAKSHSNREKYRALAPFHSTGAAKAGGENNLFFI